MKIYNFIARDRGERVQVDTPAPCGARPGDSRGGACPRQVPRHHDHHLTEIVTMSCYRILLCSVPGCLDAGQLRDTAETEAGQNVNLISPHPLPPDHFQFPSCVSGSFQTSDKLIVTFV